MEEQRAAAWARCTPVFFAGYSQGFAFPGRGEGWQPPAKPTNSDIESTTRAKQLRGQLPPSFTCLSSASLGVRPCWTWP